MANPVHSKQLAVFASLGFVPTVIFTAPAGYVSIVTTISVVTGLNALNTYWAITHSPSGARIASASHPSGTTDYTNDLLNGRWTLNAGESLAFASDGSSWDGILSGYLLTL